MTDLLYGLLPEHLLLALLLALMVFEMAGVRRVVSTLLVNVMLVAACAVLLQQYASGYERTLLPDEIRVDEFAVIAKLVLFGCALLFNLVFAADTTFKSAFLVCSSLFGAAIIVDSLGFISLFIGIEMLSLPAFALMVHASGDTTASEGAFKYLLLSAIATAFVLFGIACAYGATGSLSLAAFANAIESGSTYGLAAGLLVASGLFLKAAVFPFHGWAPDAYSSARTCVTAFLASIVKGAVVLTLVRIFGSVEFSPPIATIITTLTLLSIYFGNLTAIKQQGFKRLLAYSSIAHAGYMVFAFIDTTGSRTLDVLWYVGIYASIVILACASFAVLCPGEGDDVHRLKGGFQRHPIAAIVFGLAMLSLAGLPPLPGFFAKLFVFSGVVASGHLPAAVIAFVGSFIGVTYYLGLFFRVFAADAERIGAQS